MSFLLFVFGWFFLPGGGLYWTATVLLLISAAEIRAAWI